MADRDLLVTISGAALSLLFYENVRSIGDQMGFLLGQTLEFVVKTYTDADNQVETVKIHNNIETVVSCPLPDLLHDSTGKINKEKLKELLCDKSKQVIGWFRFRRNTSLVPTMRDKVLHKEFASYFSENNGSTEDFFVTCILSSSTSAERGTHKFRHVFLRRRRGVFEPISLRINNLGNDSFRHDGSDYKLAPTKKSLDAPDVFTTLVESLNLDLTRMAGLESAITIQKEAEQYLNKLIPKVCESDLEVAELEKQVQELRADIALRKMNRQLKVNGNSNIVDQECETENVSANNEGRKIERMFHTRTMVRNTCDTIQEFKDRSTSTSQTIATHKPRNTAAYIEKSVNQGKSRMLPMDVTSSPNHEPLVTSLSEMKVDLSGKTLNRNRRSLGTASEIVRESICKGEGNNISVGKGRGKIIQEYNSGLRKGKRTPGTPDTRSSTERSTHAHLIEHESPEHSIQSPLLQVSYSQAAKRNIDNARSTSDSSNN